MSPEPPSSTESRAAAVLDSLVRERPANRRRSWQLRQLERTAPDPTAAPWPSAPGSSADPAGVEPAIGGGDPYGPERHAAGRVASLLALARRHRAAVTAAAVTLAVLASVVLARRPPPIDERLPMTAAADAPDVASGNGGAAGDREIEPGSAPTGPSADSERSAPAGQPGDDPGPVEVVVHVAGAVASPGVVRLAATGRIVDAVAAAGGLRADADPDRVNLAAPVSDGQRIVIPVVGQPLPEEVVAAPPPGATAPGDVAGPGDTSASVVDLNRATAEQLDTLPGVGPATAAAILAHREQSGPFRSVDGLIEVRGIGEAKLEALRDLVTVSGTG